MKKLTTFLQILVLIFFALKIAALAGVMQKPAFPPGKTASVKSQNYPSPVKDSQFSQVEGKKEAAGEPQTLLAALEERGKALDKREDSLKTEEQRLLALKKEIIEKIALLKADQDRLSAEMETVNAADSKRYKDLAKVFDSTPAAKAGAMLEVMDLKTAAGITMNMKKEKAGAIWGFLSPQKAVEITYEITRAGKQRP
jgi:flagellar motility protein MotE (MotC chaperone)